MEFKTGISSQSFEIGIHFDIKKTLASQYSFNDISMINVYQSFQKSVF